MSVNERSRNPPGQTTAPQARLTGFLLLTALVSLVSDGWAGKPAPLPHQLLLLPCTLAFGILLSGA